jgi:raffinose synthase
VIVISPFNCFITSSLSFISYPHTSFYTDLSAERFLRGLQSFKSTGVMPRFVILDDGWQHTNVNDKVNGGQWGGYLTSFDANFKFHPAYNDSITTIISSSHAEVEIKVEAIDGSSSEEIKASIDSIQIDRDGHYSLSSVIQEAKVNHSISQFLVWHSLTGYWAGVMPKPNEVKSSTEPTFTSKSETKNLALFGSQTTFPYISNSMHRMSVANALPTEPFSIQGVGLVDRSKAEAFYSAYHDNLKRMGVDGVKVDAQSILPLLTDKRFDLFFFTTRNSIHSYLFDLSCYLIYHAEAVAGN